MSGTSDVLRLAADVTNPGQFFACCGLLELADRHWSGADGWFEPGAFCLAAHDVGVAPRLSDLVGAAAAASFGKCRDEDEDTVAPLRLGAPFDLRLDWWLDDRSGGSQFKTWAGQQKVVRIAGAMHATLPADDVDPAALLQRAAVMFDPAEPKKTVEPFYLDARRASQAHSVDIGFSPDAQNFAMPVYAAVEFFCLVGLQRFRPAANADRTFSYWTWSRATPLSPLTAAAVASGGASLPGTAEYRFRLLYRTKYLKGFLPAQLWRSAR